MLVLSHPWYQCCRVSLPFRTVSTVGYPDRLQVKAKLSDDARKPLLTANSQTGWSSQIQLFSSAALRIVRTFVGAVITCKVERCVLCECGSDRGRGIDRTPV